MRGSNRVTDEQSKRVVIEAQALRLRQYVIDAITEKTGVQCPKTMSLDQLVRKAASVGIGLYFYSGGIDTPAPDKYIK